MKRKKQFFFFNLWDESLYNRLVTVEKEEEEEDNKHNSFLIVGYVVAHAGKEFLVKQKSWSIRVIELKTSHKTWWKKMDFQGRTWLTGRREMKSIGCLRAPLNVFFQDFDVHCRFKIY